MNLFSIKAIVISIADNSKSNIMRFSVDNLSDCPTYKLNITMPYFQLDTFYNFKSIFSNVYIEKYQPLITDFYYNNLINLSSYNIQDSKVLSEYYLYDFEFVSQCITHYESFYSLLIIFYNSKFISFIISSITIFLMRKIGNAFCILVFKHEPQTFKTRKRYVVSYSWFTNLYNFILSRTHWIYMFIQNLNVNKLYISIINNVYKNIKHLISRYKPNYNLNKPKVSAGNTYIIYVPYITMLSNSNLNVIYASLSVVYILLGWLLDYLSFIWIFSGENMQFKFISTLGFWIKHFIYAILYISWLFIGVFSTNSIYYSLLNKINKFDNFNILIFVLGSIFTYVFSNLWFLYGLAVDRAPINLVRFIKNLIMFPIFLIENFYVNISVVIRDLFYRFIEIAFLPLSFNYYSALRRSIFEWLSFLAMVFSTYGSWNLYVIHVYYRITVIQNIVIWLISSFLNGYGLIYIEEHRPRFSNFYYGIFYLFFWTSVCFCTNSIILSYFNINNALHGLYYFLPINFVLAFIYCLPFYRLNTNLSIFTRLLHLLFFVALVAITLLSAGLLWYILGPM